MMTKEVWDSLSQKEQLARLGDILAQLEVIANGKHELTGTGESGRIPAIKKALEEQVLNILEWKNTNL